MSFKTAVDITQHWNKELNIIVRYYQNKNVNVNYQLRGLMASQPGLWASQPGLRASQPDLRTSQPDLRASQPGLRASKPSLRASQPGWGGRTERRTNKQTDRKFPHSTGLRFLSGPKVCRAYLIWAPNPTYKSPLRNGRKK